MQKGSLRLKLALAFMLPSTLSIAADSQIEFERYLKNGQTVLSELKLENPNTDFIDSLITAMLEDAKPVLRAYGEKHAQCAEQLAKLIELFPEINTWSAQKIRSDIEAAAALPQAEGCYPARDIIAHPAIARAMARQGIPTGKGIRLIREMNEAIEHMQEIQTELQQL